MCGRFVLFSEIKKVAREFDVNPGTLEFASRYNIAPTQEVLIVMNDGIKKLVNCKWGLIPPWSKDPKIGYKMINARAETLTEKSSFKTAIKKHRCLVVADGFYEWQKEGKVKRPMYVHLKSGRPFGFAGLYSHWETPDHEIICTCTIITIYANKLLEPIHSRMPAIIPRDHREKWLDPDLQDEKRMTPLLTPYASEEMQAYYVSQAVNSPKNDSEENIERIIISAGDY